jgi:Protein of unknown function (DUF4199)
MTKTVLKFGLLAGALMSALMVATIPFMSHSSQGMLVGYATMVAGFLSVYFGVRSYRDRVAGGAIGFGRALVVGALITAVASACYVATWEVVYFKFMPNFAEDYGRVQLERAKAAGRSDAELEAMRREMAKFAESYHNPVYNVAMTFLEPLPVGLLFTLVSAAALRRRREETAEERQAA